MGIRDTFKYAESGANDFRDEKAAPELPNGDVVADAEFTDDSVRNLIELPEIQ